jgi:hypothetical protein
MYKMSNIATIFIYLITVHLNVGCCHNINPVSAKHSYERYEAT